MKIEAATNFKILKLRGKRIRIVGYSHSEYTNSQDRSSKLVQILLLIDNSCAEVLISIKIYMLRRVNRSVLSAEIMSVALDILIRDTP